jgi:hypothetical protein
MFIARQRLSKQVPAVTKKQAKIEVLLSCDDGIAFSVRIAPRLYNEYPRPSEGITEEAS